MKLTSINIVNFKAFKKFKIQLENMNILIGNNNSGKTTIISALRLLTIALEHGRKKILFRGNTNIKLGYMIYQNQNYLYHLRIFKMIITMMTIHI
jgi:predicted ATP-dependent endonuclease of OLD family